MKLIISDRLWVLSSFTEKFGSEDIAPAKSVPAFKTLEKPMYDREIRAELGAEECTLSDIVAFLKDPPKGCDDGNYNLFYVSGFVVLVRWYSGVDGWSVRGWSLDRSRDAGARVFSRNWSSNPESKSLDSLPLGDLEARIAELERVIKHHNL